MRFRATVGSLGALVSCALAATAQSAVAPVLGEGAPSPAPAITAPNTTLPRGAETQGAQVDSTRATSVVKATEPKERPAWSLGAGLYSPSWLPTVEVTLLDAPAPSAFAYGAVVEHRLGENTWLALSGVVSFWSREQAVQPFAAGDEVERDSIRIHSGTTAALLGVRHTFVRRLVAVSFDAAVILGRQKLWRDDLRPTETIAWQESIPSRTYMLGAKVGVDVERELVEQLALRLTLDVGSATFSSWKGSRIDPPNIATPITRSGWRAGLTLQTGLQLHFYF